MAPVILRVICAVAPSRKIAEVNNTSLYGLSDTTTRRR